MDATRKSIYETVDLPALTPLPSTPYEQEGPGQYRQSLLQRSLSVGERTGGSVADDNYRGETLQEPSR